MGNKRPRPELSCSCFCQTTRQDLPLRRWGGGGCPVSRRPGRHPAHQPGQWSILEPRVSGTRGGEARTCSFRVPWGGQAQIQWVKCLGRPWLGRGGFSSAPELLRGTDPRFHSAACQKLEHPQWGRLAAEGQAESGGLRGPGLATGTWGALMGHVRRSGVSGPESHFIKIPAKPGDKPQSVGFYCLISKLSVSGSI